MNMSTTLLKQKANKITYGISALLIGAVLFGTTATTFANGNYGGQRHYGGYGRDGGHHERNRHDRKDRRHHHNRYTQFRWVYDRYEREWILIAYNQRTDRWEVLSGDSWRSFSSRERWSDRYSYRNDR